MHYLETLFPEYFSKAHRLALLSSLAFSALFLILLVQYHPTIKKNRQERMATITLQTKVVSRKFSDSLSFSDIPTGDSVFNGDQIFTGENSGATVVFADSRNVINIPGKSLIKIEHDQNGESVEIKNGLAEFIIQKDQVLNIVKGKEVVSISSASSAGGVATVYISGDKLILNVKKGSISLDDKATGKQDEIFVNENVSLGEGDIKKIVGFEVKSPTSGQSIDKWIGLTIDLGKREPVKIYLSGNSDFKDIAFETDASSFPFHWSPEVNPGNYFLKIKSQNGYETTLPINFYSPYEISQMSPASGETVRISRGDKILLKWNGGDAKKFKVKIQDSLGKQTEFTTLEPMLELTNIKGRSVTWSVAPMIESGKYLAQSKSNEVLISYIGANKLITPNATENSYKLNGAPIHFSWDGKANEKYKVIIQNKTFSADPIEKIVSTNYFDYTPSALGQIVFTLESIDYPSTEKVNFSLDVNSISAIWDSASPREFANDEERKDINLGFDSKVADLKTLGLKVSSTLNFDHSISMNKINSKNVNFTMTKFGNYCFKLHSLLRNSYLLDSEALCVKFVQSPPFAPLETPKDLVLSGQQINGVEAYIVEVPLTYKAVSFELQIFKDPKATNLVFSTRSVSNKITWVSNKSGIYYYRYRVLDSKNKKSDYSQIGRLIFPISPLSDWEK